MPNCHRSIVAPPRRGRGRMRPLGMRPLHISPSSGAATAFASISRRRGEWGVDGEREGGDAGVRTISVPGAHMSGSESRRHHSGRMLAYLARLLLLASLSVTQTSAIRECSVHPALPNATTSKLLNTWDQPRLARALSIPVHRCLP